MPPRGAVEYPAPLLHEGNLLGADEVRRFRRERGVHGQEIGAGQERDQVLGRFDAELRGPFRRQEGIEADNFHVQARGPSRHFPSDASQADHAESFAGELRADELRAFPFFGVQALVGRGNMTCQGHHHRDRMLSGADGIAAGRVHDNDALARGGGDIDIVHSHPGTNDGAQLSWLLQKVRGHFGLAAHHHAVSRLKCFAQGLVLEPRPGVYFQAGLLQKFHAIGAKFVADEYTGHWFHLEIKAF